MYQGYNEGTPYRSMIQMIGETRIEALAAAEASAANRRARLEVFHALSCAVGDSFVFPL